MPRVFLGADPGDVTGRLSELIAPDDRFWELIDVVDRLDLSEFERGYRADGAGGRPYDPRLMVVAVVWCVRHGQRSPSQMARCARDWVTLRAWFGRSVPGVSTFRRFVVDHGRAWSEFFPEVLSECDRVGLVDPAVSATDGSVLGSPGSLRGQVPLWLLRQRIRSLDEELEQTLADNAAWATALGRAEVDVADYVEQVCEQARLTEATTRRRLDRLVAAEQTRVQRAEREHDTGAERERLQGWLERQQATLDTLIAAQQARVDRHARGEQRSGPAPVAPADHSRVKAQLGRIERTQKNFTP